MTEIKGGNNGSQSASKPDYYNTGCTEVAKDTALVIKRLQTRRRLTKNWTRLVIVLVGLPARGKSFLARKFLSFFNWNGSLCKIFNVGRYRREAARGACDANFFDSKNEAAANLREKVAEIALRDMLKWLDGEGEGEGTSCYHCNLERIAIFDATNSTDKRRKWVLDECTNPEKRPGKPTGVIFVESICDDKELLEENFRYKVMNSPDYKDMDVEEATRDLRNRTEKYEAQYETITDDSCSYIKVYNLSSKVLANHIYGQISKVIVPNLMAWNIGTRPIFLCRPGQTLFGLTTDLDDNVLAKDIQINGAHGIADLSSFVEEHLLRNDSLGDEGKKFSGALYDFLFEESMNFIANRKSILAMTKTSTSFFGLADSFCKFDTDSDSYFPVKIFTSTMPRAVETVNWEKDFDFLVNELPALNPIDKGEYTGKRLNEIQNDHPSWYADLKKDPLKTRFPGGESLQDLIHRLEPVVVELEQQVIPTIVVSHVSVLQMLVAYFRNTPVCDAMQIEVPLHTMLKFTPSRGGGWVESSQKLASVDELQHQAWLST